MKRRRSVGAVLTLGAALTACGRRNPDPCEPESFNSVACEQAVQRGGYYNGGVWIPHYYAYPYPFYFSRYGSYRTGTPYPTGGGGGVVGGGPAGGGAPSGGAAAPSGTGTPSSGSVSRGGFGSTAGEGAGHGGSGGGE